MKTAVRLGVIGYGRRIHGLIQGPFREVEPDLRLVGVVDPDEQGARARIDGLGPHTAEGVRFYDDVAALLRDAAGSLEEFRPIRECAVPRRPCSAADNRLERSTLRRIRFR